MSAYDAPTLDSATIARIADLRSRGYGWDHVARDLGRRAIDLTGACYDDTRYEKALARAKRELRDERTSEACTRLQMQIRDPSDPKRALEAAKALAEIVLAEEARESKERIETKKCDTRLELERMRDRRNAEREALAAKLEIENLRCETRLKVEELRAAARGQKAEKPDPADRPLTEKEEQQMNDAFWRGQERVAAEFTGPLAEVYLWGGAHPICNGTPPGRGDTRVAVVRDENVRGRRVFWATTHPMPTDTLNGPFLDPPTETEGARGGAPDSA